ncbi:hypothetical protein C8D92_105237 [Tamilnaduibacter salinus]|uniref:TRAP-type C4-dicarboxylate transport system substrate-binding protein n=1 Tax=Tamilnaduibacter salinus TaxID=1484056 RepID=A0A2U1CX24_9GAMM|nr:putative solute-binding protein [Tamilnaduibacter salinus]PVY76484.1 hypothetical protein C8D92_105237 [Tamilnaduibacter salinus]
MTVQPLGYGVLPAIVTLFFVVFAPAAVAQDDQSLREQVYDTDLPLAQRLEAMQALTGLSPDDDRTYRICIWDLFGRSGPIFQAAKQQRVRLMEYGVDVEMVPYTSESVMVEELKSATCDAALMSGLRARLFNRYTGTLDSIGGLIRPQQMKLALRLMADPRSRDRMVDGEYVVMGIAPGGAGYVFVDDRSINTLAKASGKRVAVLDYDPTQAEMIAGVGATPVVTDIVNAPNMFNNGVVDVLAAPLASYEVLELYKGMSPDGGIIEMPLAQITMQLIGRRDVFPNALAQLVREAFYDNYERIRGRLRKETDKVPDKWWIDIPADDRREYEKMMQQARIELRDQGYYSPDMLTLQRKIRCRTDDTRAECTNPVE